MMETHDYRIDRLRLLACFGVVMLHSSYGSGIGDLALNAVFRFSVPVFVIISGYFMLSHPVSNLWGKIFRLFAKMVLCSGIYLLYSLWRGNKLPENLILYLLTEPDHLWYLYATMGLYLITPALLPFVRSADEREYRYALGVCFVLGCCVVTLVRLNWFPILAVILDKSKLPDMVGFTGMYLLGGYFRRFGFGKRHLWLVLWGLCTGINIAISRMSSPGNLLGFLSPSVVLCGCACFAVFMALPNVSNRFQPPVKQAAECTMGVYLFHYLTSGLITPYIGISRQLLGGAAAMALRGVLVFAVTMGLVWLLRKIPFLKKWMF